MLEADPDNVHLRGPVTYFGFFSRYFRALAEEGQQIPDFYTWVGAQQREAATAQVRSNEQLLPLTLAPQCRKRIDENQALRPDELTAFWDTLHWLSAQTTRSMEGGTQAIDAVFGGIAVLLLLHRDWVREEPARQQWCRDQLEKVLQSPPGRKPYEIPESTGGWAWETFAAECGVALLADDAQDSLARELVLAGLTCFRYDTVAATMRCAYKLRNRLRAEFDRMVAFVGEWSALRWAIHWSEQWELDAQRFWTSQCVPRLNAFASGGDLRPPRGLGEIDEAGRRLAASLFAAYRTKYERLGEGWLRWIARWTGIPWVIDQVRGCFPAKNAESLPDWFEDDGIVQAASYHPTLYRGIPPTRPGLDLQFLDNGFAWLDMAVKEQPLSEQVESALRGLLDVSLRTVTPVGKKKGWRSNGFPTKFDESLYERIGQALPRLPDKKAEDLWRPILSLGVMREHWLTYFLSKCFRAAADQAVQPDVFVALWKQLVRFALHEPAWDASGDFGSDADDVVHELLGFDMGKAVFGNDVRYAQPVASMTALFEAAASRWFAFGKVAAGFCRFALKPAGAELLLPGVRWLAAAEVSWSKWSWEHDGLAESLVDLLRTALDRHRNAIAANSESRAAFFHLCNQLTARGYHAALALRERIATGHSEENMA